MAISARRSIEVWTDLANQIVENGTVRFTSAMHIGNAVITQK